MVARSKGIDIYAVGSGNPGASNVARAMGVKWGVLVFALDGLKGAIPAAVGLLLDSQPGAYLLITAAVLGHMYPVTRHFKGGKGVATMAGAILVLYPIVFLALLVVWYVTRKLTGKASVASLVLAIALPVGVAIEGAPAWEILAVVGLVILGTLRHLDNIKRLLTGSELSASQSED